MENEQTHVNTIASILIRGVAGLSTVEAIPDITPDSINKWGQLIIQVVIGIATLLSMFKKAKQPNISVNKEEKVSQD